MALSCLYFTNNYLIALYYFSNNLIVKLSFLIIWYLLFIPYYYL